MRLINSGLEILEQQPGLDGMYKQIELAGRTCYHSEDKITEDSAKAFVDRMIKSGHCYTGDSEVLTIEGWKKWKDYNGEKIAVVDVDGSFKGYEIPINIISKEYSGKFYTYNTIGLKVTDGHRMFGMFANSSQDRYKNFEGELFSCNTPYQDANKRNKTLGERWFKTQCVCNYNNIKLSPYYQLIGFWLGDGCKDTSKDRLRFHLKKDRKVEYLTELCLNLGYNFQYNNYHFDIKCSGIGEYFNSTFVRNSEKYINLNYTNNLDEIYSIIDGLLNSDGSFQKTGISFYSTSSYLINYIYSKGPLVGYNVSIGKWKKGLLENCKQVERLFILKSNNKIVNDSRKSDSKVIITEESLPVYCVTVSSGLILVRGSNGVISICGNCAMLEHGTIYLKITKDNSNIPPAMLFWRNGNKYSKVVQQDDVYYVTTNFRVIIENNRLEDLQYICEPTEFHEKRVTVKWTCDRVTGESFLRHRVFSFARESTRYCNYYSKDKFGNEIKFIIPTWVNDIPNNTVLNGLEETFNFVWSDLTKPEVKLKVSEYTKTFLYTAINSELGYLNLIQNGYKPQQARQVLSFSVHSPLVMTGFLSDWTHFFELRCAPSAHPDAQKLAKELLVKLHEMYPGKFDELYNKYIEDGKINKE